jgi:hypothetical protein
MSFRAHYVLPRGEANHAAQVRVDRKFEEYLREEAWNYSKDLVVNNGWLEHSLAAFSHSKDCLEK